MRKLNDETLAAFADTFLTYGNRDAPYWFMGLEEGGGASVEEIEAQVCGWDTAGRPDQMSFACKAADGSAFFDTDRRGGPKLQSTWAQQIRILFSAAGRPSTNDDIRAFQAKHYGRTKVPLNEPSTCVLELFPLPRKRHNDWSHYNEISDLPQLQSLEQYKEHYTQQRLETFEQLVLKHQPEFVVGFCWTEKDLFGKWLSEKEFITGEGDRPLQAKFGHIGDTRLVIAYHPNAKTTGRKNEFYESIGLRLKGNRPYLNVA